MAAQKTHDLKVKVSEYTDKTGAKKGRWVTVGCVMAGEDGQEYWLLDRTFNPAGVPDLSGRGSESVLLCKFAPRQPGTQGPSEHQQAKSNGYAPQPSGSHGMADMRDDLPF